MMLWGNKECHLTASISAAGPLERVGQYMPRLPSEQMPKGFPAFDAVEIKRDRAADRTSSQPNRLCP
jgi:hypothetical protein